MRRTGFSWILGSLFSLAGLNGAEPKWTVRTAPSQPELPPIPSIADSPVKYLSNLLAAPSEERERMLGLQAEKSKAFWLRKIAEYERFPEAIRQAQLKTAQLYWYLALLIPVSADVRMKRLEQIPAAERVLVERCLEQWDELPGNLRDDILGNIKVIHYFARLEINLPEERPSAPLPPPLKPANPPASAWANLPLEKQREIFGAYARFYELPASQQKAALEKMPFPVRREFESRLDKLSQMPPDQKQKCIRFLRAFAEMTPEERARFRGNAERWQDMNLQERSFWTDYIKRLPKTPPLPPGVKPASRNAAGN